MVSKVNVVLLGLAVLVGISSAIPMPRAYPMPVAYAMPTAYASPDGGYSPYKKEELGRVKIQVYRGPNKEKVGYEYFAPWGYYFTQPEDYKPQYGYH